jgi:type III secretion system low calcium response chaperone LcrH/SycD
MSTATPISSDVQSILDLKAALEALPSSSRLSQADTDAIYALAHQLVMQGRYETAFRYFSLLTLYKPTDITYLQGLALTYRMLERYDEALNVYSFLAVLDPENLDFGIAIAECQMLKHDFNEAQETMALVLQHCKEKSIHNNASIRAGALWDLLSPHRGAAPVGA